MVANVDNVNSTSNSRLFNLMRGASTGRPSGDMLLRTERHSVSISLARSIVTSSSAMGLPLSPSSSAKRYGRYAFSARRTCGRWEGLAVSVMRLCFLRAKRR